MPFRRKIIVLGAALAAVAALAPLHGESRAVYYRVRSGDTLSGISEKFNVPMSRLERMNGLRRNQPLRAGRSLKVGVRRAAPAPRRSEPVGQRWVNVGPETQSLLPLNYSAPAPKTLRFQNEHFELRLYSRAFAQGDAVYLEITSPPGKPPLPRNSYYTAKLDDESIPLTGAHFGLAAVFALPPDMRPGPKRIDIKLSLDGAVHQYGYRFSVGRRAFPATVWRVRVKPPNQRTAPDPDVQQQQAERARREGEKKARVFAINSTNMLANRTAHPRDSHKITSQYYTLRRINRFYYQNRRRIHDSTGSYRHRGVDLRGRIGEPVFAMAHGRVVCAERMRGEGNFVVIDHGNKIFTGYMHLNQIQVYEGMYVQAGQQIGTSGATGNVTGAHLHMSLWVRGAALDALSLLSLPIRF